MKQLYTLCLLFIFSVTLSSQVEVTFAVDMGEQDVDAVFVAGDFQQWTPGDGALSDDDGDNIWTRTYTLNSGDIAYKFGIGNDWGNNETGEGGIADCATDDNRTATISDASTVLAFGYNSCESIDLMEDDGMVDVTFAVDLGGQMVDAIFVAGEFQNWTPGDGALTDDDGNNVWRRTYELMPGTYLFKFGIGNDWGNNEGGGLEACGVDDGNGGFNRTVTIPEDVEEFDVAFEYDSCAEFDLSNVRNVSSLGTVRVAPNPMTDITRITFDNRDNVAHDVRIVNMNGQVVRTYNSLRGNELVVERGNLLSGLYFVSFRNAAGETGSLKLVVR